MQDQSTRRALVGLGAILGAMTSAAFAQSTEQTPEQISMSPAMIAAMGGGNGKSDDEFPKFSDVSDDYTKVVSTADGSSSMWNIWIRNKDGQMLGEIPPKAMGQRYFVRATIASGSLWAGHASSTDYFYLKQFNKKLMIIRPETLTRSTGDPESKASVGRHFTDRVVADVPIVTMGPSGGPVVDLDRLLVRGGGTFLGWQGNGFQADLAEIHKAKAFPGNVELAFDVPNRSGQLQTVHYSISTIPDNTGYKPRESDLRVGYFTTVYRDLGKLGAVDKWTRYINRWHLEKADPSLKMSPPKEPIVFYVEHTVPIRYRQWVRAGVEYWNKAFENIGIRDAIEVRYQDKRTGAHMDKDPEDVRYNFLMWLSNDISTAIGPSRVHPLTGQILDADIVLTDGWIRAFWTQANELLPDLALEGMSPQDLAWLDRNPRWDPRVRLAPPAEREQIVMQRQARRGIDRFAGHPAANVDHSVLGDEEFDGLGLPSQNFTVCNMGKMRSFQMANALMHFEVLGMFQDEHEGDEEGDGEGEPKEEKGDTLDGIPDWFVGPLLADLVAHEVGHTIGLRHNFKASAIYTLDEINSDKLRGIKPFTGSVMDYNPVNINLDEDRIQGDYAMIDIGPYDKWAIEYGYTFDDPKKVLERVSEPELAYLTDEDTWGPDPLARRYDFSANPIEYAEQLMELATYHRERLLDSFVKDGDSWAKARRGYNITLGQHFNAISIMSNWIGGSFIVRDKKGDPGDRQPITPVDAEVQRDALAFVIDNAFEDEAFGLTNELMKYLTVDKRWDASVPTSQLFADPNWPVHDRILGIQASVMTMLMNPTTLQRVFDNEFIVPSDEDALTLAELLVTVEENIFRELESRPTERYTAREPMISSLRRNLQREYLERLIDLTRPDQFSGAYAKPMANLATHHLREMLGEIKPFVDGSGSNRIDPYSLAHLSEAKIRIEQALDATVIYNTDEIGGGGTTVLMLGREADEMRNRR
ncbi:MAG: zinc-dependent metalloprotease [Planctomycetota bacterium]